MSFLFDSVRQFTGPERSPSRVFTLREFFYVVVEPFDGKLNEIIWLVLMTSLMWEPTESLSWLCASSGTPVRMPENMFREPIGFRELFFSWRNSYQAVSYMKFLFKSQMLMPRATDSFLSCWSQINSQFIFFAEKYHRFFLDCLQQLICYRDPL